MIDERRQELASLYALDLLEGTERTAFEAELAGDPALRVLVRELREAAGTLALAAPAATPAPELKARILEKITSLPRPAGEMIRPSPFAFGRVLPWLAAAAAVVAAALLGQRYLAMRTENALLRDQQTLADFELRSARNLREADGLIAKKQLQDAAQRLAAEELRTNSALRQLDRARELIATREGQLADEKRQLAALEEQSRRDADLAHFKIATLASLAGNSPEALAVAVWNPARQEGVFKIEKMPRPASDQDYELWVIDPSQPKPVSAGVFTVGADGGARVAFHPASPVAHAAKFAVSRERKGGAPANSGPQGPVLMLGE